MDANQKRYEDDKLRELDDAEKGIYEHAGNVIVRPPLVHIQETLSNASINSSLISPLSPIHEGITPSSSVQVLTLARPGISEKPSNNSSTVLLPIEKSEAQPQRSIKAEQPKKKKVSRWILFRLWFNTYRMLFTFVTTLNMVGLIMAAIGHFAYSEGHIGALVLGNLLFAVLMRNELFLRFLYLVAIYGLRGVSVCRSKELLNCKLTSSPSVGSSMDEIVGDFILTACWWITFGMCALGCSVR